MKTSSKRIETLQIVKIWGLVTIFTTLTFSSCSEEGLACEGDNTGTIIVENSRAKGIVKVYFNETGRIPINGPGDLNVAPGENASTTLPGGLHNVKAVLSITDCSAGRCSTSTSGLPEKNVDLSSCEDLNLTY